MKFESCVVFKNDFSRGEKKKGKEGKGGRGQEREGTGSITFLLPDFSRRKKKKKEKEERGERKREEGKGRKGGTKNHGETMQRTHQAQRKQNPRSPLVMSPRNF